MSRKKPTAMELKKVLESLIQTLEQMERRSDCRICGSCSPVQLFGYHAVVGTAVRQVTSPYTGSVYLEPVEYVAELYGEEPAEGYAKTR